MKKSFLTAAFISCAIVVGSSAAASAGGGNSAAAKQCQKGGWQEWVREDRSVFVNQGDCVSYAAKGGTLLPAKPPVQIACEDLGGTFAANPEEGVIWSCTHLAPPPGMFATFFGFCFAEPGFDGLALTFGSGTTETYSCRVV